MEKLVISIRQMSELTPWSERTCERMVARGDVDSTLIGRRRLVYMDSLRELLDRGRHDRAS